MKAVKLRRLGIAAVSLMSAAVLTTTPLASTGAASADVGCTEYMVYLVPGTTETNAKADPSDPKGLLKQVGDVVKDELGSSVTIVYVPYAASAFDKGLTYKASQGTGVKSTAQLMAKCPNSKIALGGYSQGADVAGDVAWHIGHENKPVSASNVLAVGLLADPKGGKQSVVGTSRTGEGISGERPGGYGSLEPRIKWVCSEKDMYCNTTSKNPMAKVLGKALGSGGPPQGVTALDGGSGKDSMTSLAGNLGNADLEGAKSKATDLKTRTQALTKEGSNPTAAQLNSIADLAEGLNTTYSATNDAAKWATDSGARKNLESSGAGTPEKQTSDFLGTVDKTDMNGLVSDTGDIASVARSLASSLNSGSSSGALTGSGEAIQQLALKGANVALNSDALNSTDRNNLSVATGVLSTLQVSSVVDTTLTAMTVLLSTDYQGIYDDIAKMIDLTAKQDAPGVFDTSSALLDKIEPWVDLADSANGKLMPMASKMVAMIPDPQGYAIAASIGMQLFSQVDIKAIWNVARQAHSIAGSVIKGKPEALVGLIPVGLNLATIGVSALTGAETGLGGSSSQTGTTGSTGNGQTGLDSVVQGADASGQNLMSVASKFGSTDSLSQLVTDGLDFASFLGSGAHTSAYTNKTLVRGYSSVEYLGRYFVAGLTGGSGSNSSGSDSSGSNGSDSSDDDSDSSKSPDSSGGDTGRGSDAQPRQPMMEG